MRPLDRLGIRPHFVKIYVIAVKFRLFFGPDFLHRQDVFPEDSPAALEISAMIPHFFRVPAAAHAEDKPASRQHIQTSDLLGRRDGVALDH